MQKCWHCEAQQYDGSIFCSECGANLSGKHERRETRTSLNLSAARERQPHDAAAAPPPVVPPPVAQTTPDITQGLRLIFPDTGQRLALQITKDLMIGRADEKRSIFPDIDLGSYGGYDAGVSRRHAILSFQNNTCILKDLDSANGTFVNERRIAANQPTSLKHGDELRFGTLQVRVEFGA